MADAGVTPNVVVFADLSPRAKVQYTRFLLEHDVKFQQRESDKRFVANIRLVRPPNAADIAAQDASNQEQEEAQRAAEEATQELMDKRLAAVPEQLRVYANLIFLIGERPKRSSANPAIYTKETRLVRFINEIYDARYEDLSASCLNGGGSFAKFIRHHLTNRFGLKRLVDQQAWDLIEGLCALQHRVDVELFSCFLQGKYPERTLAFFLFARSNLQRQLCSPAYRPMSVKPSAPDRKRKAASSTSSILVWLSRSQAETLAETVFGSKTEDTYIEFIHAMKAFLSCDSSIVRARTPARLVDANEFLFIATETYHKSSSAFPSPFGCQTAKCGSSPRHERVAPLPFEQWPSVSSDPMLVQPDQVGLPSETASSTGAVVFDGSEDENEAQLQSRLGSLLERAKKRQQGNTQ